MANKTLTAKLKQRIDSTANWTTNSNVVLENGEIGFERTTSDDIKFKVGDGNTTWANLPYVITNNTSNNQSLKVLKEKHSISNITYETSNNTLPNQTVSVYENTDLTIANATKLIAFVEDNNNYYLNSSAIPLEKLVFDDPTLVGLDANDECYSLYYNFDLSTYEPTDSTKPYYILNIIYLNSQDMYILQCMTSLTSQDAPTKWIIYELLEDEVIIENAITSNSDNLVTNKAIYNALSNLPSGGDGSGNANEIYVGTTEPTGYKMWIDPTADVSGSLESIPISYIDFTLTTVSDEEVLTTKYDFDDVETEVEAESVVIARITAGTQTLYAQLLERKSIGETPLDTFLFGVATDDSYKIFTINENDVCTVSTMSLSDDGTSFELEEDGNMLLENGILKARYGNLETSFGILYTIDENSETDDPNTYIDMDPDGDLGIAKLMIYNLNNTYPIITAEENSSTEATLILRYSDDTTRELDLEIESTEIDGITIYYAGDMQLSAAMDNLEPEDTGYVELASYIQQHSDSYFFTNFQTESNGNLLTQIVMIMPIDYLFSSSGNGQFIKIDVQGPTTEGYPIPATALRAENGIAINPETGAIGLAYGQKIKEQFISKFSLDYNSIPSTNIFGSLYGWYCENLSATAWEQDASPNSFSYFNNLYLNRYKEGEFEEIQDISHRPNSYQSTIDYNEDTYYTIPFYFATKKDFDNNSLENALVELKELPYTNNLLYTAAASALDTNNSSSNIFYGGGYNTDDDYNDLINNGSLRPVIDTKPAIYFLILDQPSKNNTFFWIYSNENDLQLDDKDDDGYQLQSGKSFDINNSMPLSLFNYANKLSNKKQQLVIGMANDISEIDEDQGCLIINDTSNNYDDNTSFCAGSGGNKTLYVHGNYVDINGTLRINNKEIPNINKMTYLSSINQISDTTNATIEDIALAYNNLANRFNTLLTYLQNNNYMYIS